jgi:hypothetical protein
MANKSNGSKKRPVKGRENELRAAPKRAGSTTKPAAAARYSTQMTKKVP